MAVLLWSSSASVAAAVRSTTNFASLVVGLQVGGLIVHGILCLRQRIQIRGLWSNLGTQKAKRAYVSISLIWGALVSLYYGLYYFSIQQGPAIPVNIINFLWPLLIPVLAHYVFRHERRHFSLVDGGLLLLALFGAALVAWDFSSSKPWDEFEPIYLVALVAAFCAAGFINVGMAAQRRVDSIPLLYFLGMSIALALTLIAFLAAGIEFEFELSGVLPVAYLGLVVFGFGSAVWLLAVTEGGTLSISSLAYLTPVLSTLLLNILVGEEMVPTVAFGALLIVACNVLIHNKYQHFHALRGTFVAFFASGIVVYLEPSVMLPHTVGVVAGYPATVFSIFAGFILTRVWDRNRREDELVGRINSDLVFMLEDVGEDVHLHGQPVKDATIALVQRMVDLAYCKNTAMWHRNSRRVQESVEVFRRAAIDYTVRQPTCAELQARISPLREKIFAWMVLSLDRVSVGEMALLSALGTMSAVSFIVASGRSFYGDLFAVTFSAAMAFVILRIRDYNMNRSSHDARKIILQQEPLRILGSPYYVPGDDFVLEMAQLKGDFKVSLPEGDEVIGSASLESERKWLRIAAAVLAGMSLVSIVALFYLKYY